MLDIRPRIAYNRLADLESPVQGTLILHIEGREGTGPMQNGLESRGPMGSRTLRYTCIALVALILSSRVVHGQVITFERTYLGQYGETAAGRSVQQTYDGGYIIDGQFGSGIYNVDQSLLLKTTAQGDIEWSYREGSYREARAGSFAQQTPDSGYIAIGTIAVDPDYGFSSLYYAKFDALGTRQWVVSFVDQDPGSFIAMTSDSGYIATGGYPDMALIKSDADGQTVWLRTIGGENPEQGNCVRQTGDGGYLVAGYTASFGAGSDDVYLVRTDANGDTVWTRTYGGDRLDKGNSLQLTRDGGYVIAGTTMSFGAGAQDFYLIRTDANGDTVWTRTYGGENDDVGHCVDQTADGGFIMVGTTESYGAGGQDLYLVKTDSDGNLLWSRTYGGNRIDTGMYVEQTSDLGYVLVGQSYSFGYGSVYLVKTDPDGMVGIGGAESPPAPPRAFGLSQNYPNPFNPSTTIAFDIPGEAGSRQPVSLMIYDVRGRLVRTLVDSDLPPGSHRIHWNGRCDDGTYAPSGIYLYRLQSGSASRTRKMLALK